MSNENFKLYIKYMGALLKEQAKEAKLDADKPDEGFEDYNTGQLMAYYSVLTLLKNQASTFDISQEEIGLADIDPDADLLSLHRRDE
jgi:hypothetical protein